MLRPRIAVLSRLPPLLFITLSCRCCATRIWARVESRLTLPRQNFRHPEDATEQLRRGLELHERLFGRRPSGVWPSEGSVSNEVLTLAARLGIEWMATDEGCSGAPSIPRLRETARQAVGRRSSSLYNIYRSEQDESPLHLIFRDHSLSDLIGFVYSGMPPQEAVQHFLRQLRESAQPVLAQGRDAIVPIILDGENAWEYYPARDANSAPSL